MTHQEIEQVPGPSKKEVKPERVDPEDNLDDVHSQNDQRKDQNPFRRLVVPTVRRELKTSRGPDGRRAGEMTTTHHHNLQGSSSIGLQRPAGRAYFSNLGDRCHDFISEPGTASHSNRAKKWATRSTTWLVKRSAFSEFDMGAAMRRTVPRDNLHEICPHVRPFECISQRFRPGNC